MYGTFCFDMNDYNVFTFSDRVKYQLLFYVSYDEECRQLNKWGKYGEKNEKSEVILRYDDE